ncbi:MAG: YggS family pyridoxal phosphate-dependent enzyme [Bacteroidetes bacterium]|nr:MAG: YggS family pyridoxal phosphate-dependent enzyme [Bacteroidota bacterium]
MSFISDQIEKILTEIPKEVKLIAVSKTHPTASIQEAYDRGYRIFGESRPQELKEKYTALPKDIEWHMIGNLQKNKVKYIAPFVALIHSVDSLSLLKVIEKEAKKNNRVISFLLQLKVAQEATKSGLSLEDTKDFLNSVEFAEMRNVSCCGIMGMATFTNDNEVVRSEFALLKKYFDELKADFFSNDSTFKEISMGMSGDYTLAIEEGSTIIRVGSKIFGAR